MILLLKVILFILFLGSFLPVAHFFVTYYEVCFSKFSSGVIVNPRVASMKLSSVKKDNLVKKVFIFITKPYGDIFILNVPEGRQIQ